MECEIKSMVLVVILVVYMDIVFCEYIYFLKGNWFIIWYIIKELVFCLYLFIFISGYLWVFLLIL